MGDSSKLFIAIWGAPLVELWGLFFSIKLAHNLHINSAILELDSSVIVNINSVSSSSH